MAATLANLGSRPGDGQAQGVYRGHRCAGLLLRSTKSLAARDERKHQPSVEAILPAEDRLIRPLASASRPDLAAPESTVEKNARLPDSCEETASKFCIDRL